MELLHEYTVEDVASHSSADDCWIILGEESCKKIYDITAFLEEHPGGPEVLLDLAGQDANDEFEEVGHSKKAHEMVEQLCIGKLKVDVGVKKIKKRVFLPIVQEDIKPHSSKRNTILRFIAALIVVILSWFIYRYLH